MKYELIATDRKGTDGVKHLGKVSDFVFDGETFRFGFLRSSRVKSISISGSLMIVQTLNTLYTFKQVGED